MDENIYLKLIAQQEPASKKDYALQVLAGEIFAHYNCAFKPNLICRDSGANLHYCIKHSSKGYFMVPAGEEQNITEDMFIASALSDAIVSVFSKYNICVKWEDVIKEPFVVNYVAEIYNTPTFIIKGFDETVSSGEVFLCTKEVDGVWVDGRYTVGDDGLLEEVTES